MRSGKASKRKKEGSSIGWIRTLILWSQKLHQSNPVSISYTSFWIIYRISLWYLWCFYDLMWTALLGLAALATQVDALLRFPCSHLTITRSDPWDFLHTSSLNSAFCRFALRVSNTSFCCSSGSLTTSLMISCGLIFVSPRTIFNTKTETPPNNSLEFRVLR